jgi:hypothetical protein
MIPLMKRAREFANPFHLDILPEEPYIHLECLLENNENA